MVVVFGVALLFSAVSNSPHDVPSLQSYSGSLFLGALFSSSVNAMMTIPLLADTMPVFKKEQTARMYHPWIHGLALSMAELPWVMLNTAVHMCLFYPIAGLYSDVWYILYYAMALVLMQVTSILSWLRCPARPPHALHICTPARPHTPLAVSLDRF